jgi:two-component system cell cycle response regulator DivK
MAMILLVEDNEDNRNMLSRRLQRNGYEVSEASDGESAIQMANEVLPNLILMDINLPVIDGWEATRRLKANSLTSHIPVIALTAHANSEDRERSFQAGCAEHETKPIDLPRLLAKMRLLISN